MGQIRSTSAWKYYYACAQWMGQRLRQYILAKLPDTFPIQLSLDTPRVRNSAPFDIQLVAQAIFFIIFYSTRSIAFFRDPKVNEMNEDV